MAETWIAYAPQLTFATGNAMVGLFNGSGSSYILRVYEVRLANPYARSPTGALTCLQIATSTAQSSGWPIIPVALDTNNTALDSNVSAAVSPEFTKDAVIRKFLWANDDPAAGGSGFKEWQNIRAMGTAWDGGYHDSAQQPITLRPGHGVIVEHLGSTNAGEVDISIMFTQAGS